MRAVGAASRYHPQPSCATGLFLRPCQLHDSRSVVVDDADAKTQGAVITEKAASEGRARV